MIKFFRNIRQNLLSEGKTSKYFKYAIGEIVLVVIGILIALSINNWNQDRINNKNTKSKLKLIQRELDEDILSLENQIRFRTKRYQLLHRSLNILENATKLTDYNKQVLDSSFLTYTRIEPLFNNTRTYELFLSSESDIVDEAIYSNLNHYLVEFNETNARIERFGKAIIEVERDIILITSVKKKSSGAYEYVLNEIQQEEILYETIRRSSQWNQATSAQYSRILKKANELKRLIEVQID